jgi:hypothetical protein
MGVERLLFRDGASRFFEILEYSILPREVLRISTQLTYLIPYFLRLVWPDVRALAIAFGLVCLAYLCLSLLVCWKIAVRAKRPEMIAFPLIALAGGTMISTVFAPMGLNEVGSLFWMAMFGLCFSDLSRPRSVLWISIVVLLLGLSHEAAAICLPALGGALWLRTVKMRRVPSSVWIFAALISLSLLSCVLRAVSPLHNTTMDHVNFYSKLLHAVALDPFLLVAALTFLVFGLALFLKEPLRTPGLLLLFSILATALPCAWLGGFTRNPNISGMERPLVTPMIAVTAILMLIYLRRPPKTMVLLIPVSCLLWSSAVRDFMISKAWSEGTSLMEARIRTAQASCEKLTDAELSRLTQLGVGPAFVPYLSILLQRTRKLKTVLFVPSSRPFCEELLQHGVIRGMTFEGGMPLPVDGYFQLR